MSALQSNLDTEANAYYELVNFDSSSKSPQQLFEAESLAAKNSHLFQLVLYYFVVKTVLSLPSLYMFHFFRV